MICLARQFALFPEATILLCRVELRDHSYSVRRLAVAAGPFGFGHGSGFAVGLEIEFNGGSIKWFGERPFAPPKHLLALLNSLAGTLAEREIGANVVKIVIGVDIVAEKFHKKYQTGFWQC